MHVSRFLQQPSLWDKCLPPWPSPIGPKFGCTSDPQNWQIRTDLGCNSAWPSLAPGSVSYSIQAQLHHEQLPGWPCTGVPDRAPWMTFQQGATFGRRPRFSSWSLDIGRNDPEKEVSLSPHHSSFEMATVVQRLTHGTETWAIKAENLHSLERVECSDQGRSRSLVPQSGIYSSSSCYIKLKFESFFFTSNLIIDINVWNLVLFKIFLPVTSLKRPHNSSLE